MRRIGIALIALALTAMAPAHPTSIAAAKAKVAPDGAVEIWVRFDVLAFVLAAAPADVVDSEMAALLDVPDDALRHRLNEAEGRFRQGLQVLAGDPRPVDAVSFPGVADVRKWVLNNGRDRLPVMLTATARARLTDGAGTVSFRFPEVLGSVVLTSELPYQEPYSEPVEPGRSSTAMHIMSAAEIERAAAEMGVRNRPGVAGAGLHVRVSPGRQEVGTQSSQSRKGSVKETQAVRKGRSVGTQDRQKSQRREGRGLEDSRIGGLEEAGGGQVVPPPTLSGGERASSLQSFAMPEPTGGRRSQGRSQGGPQGSSHLGAYVKMGFTHILPHGVDHMLFVLGLFLLSTRMKDLVKQITAFTLAHSVTLGLAVYGVVRLPSNVVEPLIAASIVFVAIENLRLGELKPWRLGVVVLFGLVHGLGFAGALKDAGLEGNSLLAALAGFNIGVELGQLSVVAAALLAVGWLRGHARYRPLVVVPCSIALAAVAAVWTVERFI